MPNGWPRNVVIDKSHLLSVQYREYSLNPNSRPNQELKQRLKVATEVRNETAKRFKEILRDIPSGLPEPDGSQRIRNASRDLTEAQSAVVALLIELNKSSLDGDGVNRKKSRP